MIDAHRRTQIALDFLAVSTTTNGGIAAADLVQLSVQIAHQVHARARQIDDHQVGVFAGQLQDRIGNAIG